MSEQKSRTRSGSSEKQTPKQVRSAAGKEKSIFTWPFGLYNLLILFLALVVIVIGYVFLAKGPHNSAASLSIAPVLLIIGYLVLVPLAIILRDPTIKTQKDKRDKRGKSQQ